MVSSNEFWLHLHRLAEAYDAEGLTTTERTANIVEEFKELPLIAQCQVRGELLRAITYFTDLYGLVAAEVNAHEKVVANVKPPKNDYPN
jgi:hypothetical protein